MHRDRMVFYGKTSPNKTSVLLPNSRSFARIFISRTENLTEEDRASLHYICQDKTIKRAYDLVQELAAMVLQEKQESFLSWFEKARLCEIGTISRFAHNLFRDKEAIMAAMQEPWSNGQVEGQINKLKLIKRQMYGRAGIRLLRQRLQYHDK